MSYEPPFTRTPEIDALAMEIAEMVGALSSCKDSDRFAETTSNQNHRFTLINYCKKFRVTAVC